MSFLIVHAKGEECHHVTTSDYRQALAIYSGWLAAYPEASEDKHALGQLDWLSRVGEASRSWTVEYRSHRYANPAAPEQVFVLAALQWPRTWNLPPNGIDRDWGQAIKRAEHPHGRFELRTDGRRWRIFWLDRRGTAAFTVIPGRDIAAEAAAQFAFIEALTNTPPAPGRNKEEPWTDTGRQSGGGSTGT